MREIDVSLIENTVRDLCIKANLYLPKDMEQCIKCGARNEKSPVGQSVFDDIIRNIDVARDETIPICQDCGMAVIFRWNVWTGYSFCGRVNKRGN